MRTLRAGESGFFDEDEDLVSEVERLNISTGEGLSSSFSLSVNFTDFGDGFGAEPMTRRLLGVTLAFMGCWKRGLLNFDR